MRHNVSPFLFKFFIKRHCRRNCSNNFLTIEKYYAEFYIQRPIVDFPNIKDENYVACFLNYVRLISKHVPCFSANVVVSQWHKFSRAYILNNVYLQFARPAIFRRINAEKRAVFYFMRHGSFNNYPTSSTLSQENDTFVTQ